MFGNFFKPRPHYVFNYKPRYYDERKERMRKLKEKYESDENKTLDYAKIRLSKNQLKKDWIRNKGNATNKASNLRLAIIIVILVGICAYLFDLHKLF